VLPAYRLQTDPAQVACPTGFVVLLAAAEFVVVLLVAAEFVVVLLAAAEFAVVLQVVVAPVGEMRPVEQPGS